MMPDAAHPAESSRGVSVVREVADVEGEVGRLSRAGWISALWPAAPQPGEAVDLLLVAIARTARRHALEQAPRWTPDAWSRAARALLAEDRLPIPKDFGRELTLHRLVRWLEPDSRSLAIGVSSSPGGEVRTLQDLADWFSRAAEAECLILTQAGAPPASPRGDWTLRSEAERLLFDAMNKDRELRGLFEPNVKLLTRFRTRPCVDFLWREGGIILEIDSYFTHGSRLSFAPDRQRDYETLTSGYLTLRLVYEEVMRDCPLALSKVRSVVTLRRKEKNL